MIVQRENHNFENEQNKICFMLKKKKGKRSFTNDEQTKRANLYLCARIFA